ncbi:MAG: PAS domain S-box protein [Microcystaceae cyanobacterium]
MLKIEKIFLCSDNQSFINKIGQSLAGITDYSNIPYDRLLLPELSNNTEEIFALYLVDCCTIIHPLLSDLSEPIITIVNYSHQGIETLEKGAMNYLELDQLTPETLRKAIHLAIYYYQKQQKKQKETTFYQSLINNLPQSIYTKDKQGRLTFVNQAMLDSLGMNLEESKGKTVYDLYPLELAQKYDQDDKVVITTEEVLNTVEAHKVPITQELKHVQVVKSPLYNSEKKVTGTQGIFWDVSDRIAAEKALKHSEAQFRGFFEQAAVGMAIASLEGTILKINQKLCNLSGYRDLELLTKTFLELTYPDDLELTLDHIQQLLQGTINCYTLEKRYIHRDGKVIWTQVTTTLVRNENEEPAYLMAIVEDIQERKKAEEALRYRLRLENAISRASQELILNKLGNIKRVLQQIGLATHASGAYLIQFNQQGNIGCMTHEWCLKGIKPKKPQFQSVDIAYFTWWHHKLMTRQNILIPSVEQLPPQAQKERDYLTSMGINSLVAIPIYDAHDYLWGQVGLDTSQTHFKKWSDEDIYLLQIVGDMLYRYWEKVKSRKRQLDVNRRLRLLSSLTLKIRQSGEVEETLQIAVQEIRKTFRVDRVIFYRFEKDGSGKVVNESLMTGISSLLNVPITDYCAWENCHKKYKDGYVHVINDIQQENYHNCYNKLLKKCQVLSQIVVPIIMCRSDDLSLVWGLLCVQMCSKPRQWKREEMELLKQLSDQLGIALSQAQLREQEMAQKKELARSNAELEQFAYIASHDLRQPLQIVSDFTKLLQRRYGDKLDDKAHKYIEHIVVGAQRMEQQIEDLLQYSRVGRKETLFETVSIQVIVQRAIANLRKAIESSQAQITIEGEMPYLKGDGIQLVQLFQNLIDNGMKYHGETPPKIKIKGESKGDHWLFSVQDQGIGIDPIHFERVFQIFQRLHTQEEYPGTGIGLAICQRIVKRHRGNIWLESCLNQGTTFFVTLPMLN